MKSTLSRIFLFVAVAVAIAAAQNRHQPPDPATRVQEHVNFMTTVLSLTPAQQQQATTIFTNAANSAKALHEQMRTAHDALKTAIQKNDTAAIDQNAATIGNLTTQMISGHAKAQAAFNQTLTPDQQAKLSQLHSHEHGMHGPGGPHMGGPF
ncbi:MAG TPA: Spy/CpxP family protein refolding chaperone [Candidatus Angelobacter sp.]|nr:Spy/CpxP family protein refolding chaperone [Candidatus Angelobacter sp.]